MERHALAILEQNDLCNWLDTKQIQASGKQDGKFQVVTPKLLYFLIVESQGFSGEVPVPDHFWKQLRTCDEKLKENIESLKQENFVSAQKSFDVLFHGLHPTNVNFKPVLDMAVEYFTHLGVAFVLLLSPYYYVQQGCYIQLQGP
ncbi:hypothetical protein L210DRAFT_3507390 [Boletus edulis BED1]|uniref:Uncharacterized protein n=1 Tax=Boletus edulis BED1 TaxID=1328754 RepID=A0AAD4BKH5_BOLED|nr:hypothetical protein L210DRAFT_3507390 [Boletus edulis BED1]